MMGAMLRDMDTFPDLGSLSDQELKDLIQQLTDEEQEVSYRRRILHGKIDILRAELVNRLRKKHEGGEDVISGADVQRLTGDRRRRRPVGPWRCTAPNAASWSRRAPTTASAAVPTWAPVSRPATT
jgi:anti-sigma-K factor RsiG